MRTLVVVSRCLKVERGTGGGDFPFKGFYAGEEVRALHLLPPRGFSWKTGEEYVVYVKVLSLGRGTLTGEALRVRALEEPPAKA